MNILKRLWHKVFPQKAQVQVINPPTLDFVGHHGKLKKIVFMPSYIYLEYYPEPFTKSIKMNSCSIGFGGRRIRKYFKYIHGSSYDTFACQWKIKVTSVEYG